LFLSGIVESFSRQHKWPAEFFLTGDTLKERNTMLKQLIAAIGILAVSSGLALADVDVNKADQAGLDGIRGIGPAKARLILEERKKGQFKDWPDFERRIKGVGGKSAAKLSEAGLTVNGQPRSTKEDKSKAKAKD
jgi:competence protein ComEA